MLDLSLPESGLLATLAGIVLASAAASVMSIVLLWFRIRKVSQFQIPVWPILVTARSSVAQYLTSEALYTAIVAGVLAGTGPSRPFNVDEVVTDHLILSWLLLGAGMSLFGVRIFS